MLQFIVSIAGIDQELVRCWRDKHAIAMHTQKIVVGSAHYFMAVPKLPFQFFWNEKAQTDVTSLTVILSTLLPTTGWDK